MATANQSFIKKYAKGKASSNSKEASSSFAEIQKKAGVSKQEISKQSNRRRSSSRSSRSSSPPQVDTRQSTIATPTQSAGQVTAQRELAEQNKQEAINKTFLIRKQNQQTTMENPTFSAGAPGVDTSQSNLQTPTNSATRLTDTDRFKGTLKEKGETQQQKDIQKVKDDKRPVVVKLKKNMIEQNLHYQILYME